MKKLRNCLAQFKFCLSTDISEGEKNQNDGKDKQAVQQKTLSRQTSIQLQLENKQKIAESPTFTQPKKNFNDPQEEQQIQMLEIEKNIREPKIKIIKVDGQVEKMDSIKVLEQIKRKISKQQTHYVQKKNERIQRFISKNSLVFNENKEEKKWEKPAYLSSKSQEISGQKEKQADKDLETKKRAKNKE